MHHATFEDEMMSMALEDATHHITMPRVLQIKWP